MTRQEIRNRMLKSITENLEEQLKDIESLIEPEDIEEFMWTKDFGSNLIEEFLDENKADLIEEYLEEIYDSIGNDEIKAPF